MAAAAEDDEKMEVINENTAEDKEEQDMDGSDESSSSDEEEENPRIKELRELLAAKPQLYDEHIELINLLNDAGELDQCREARENMNKAYPLAPDLWLAWLKDEQKFIDLKSKSDVEKITKLFERATRDYLSVDVWLEYYCFMMGTSSREEESDKSPETIVREVLERGLTAAGLHVKKGGLLWGAYRDFETAVLAMLQPQLGSTATEEQQKAINAQIQRIKKLFHRQLSVPLRDMESTYEEYENWVDEVDPNTAKVYKDALEKLQSLEPFEDKLETCAPEEQSKVYLEYLDEVIQKKDPARTQCLFEQAITDQCLDMPIWTKYVKYLEKDLCALSSVIFNVYERGVRNVPWCTDLWLGYVRAAERHERSHHTVKALFDRALSADLYGPNDHLLVWSALLDYLRRCIEWADADHEEDLTEFRTTFEQAIQILQQAFPNEPALVVPLLKYGAWIEAKFCKNMEKAREWWNEVTKLHGANEAQTWLSFINVERAFGDRKHARKLFQRALNSVTDWPEGIVDGFVNFEREEGTLEQYDQAVDRCENQMKRINARRAEQAEKEESNPSSFRKGGGDFPKKKFEKGKGKRTQDDRQGGLQKAFQKGKKGQPPAEPAAPVYKRAKQAPAAASEAPAEKKKDSDGFAIPAPVLDAPDAKPKSQPPPGFKPKSQPPPGFKAKSAPPPGFKGNTDDSSDEPPEKRQRVDDSTEEAPAEGEATERDYTATQNRTAFISNLDFTVAEDGIREFMSKVGDITDIRLIKNAGGKSKGFAYVEFSDELAVGEALKLDRTPINGRPVFVSKCKEKAAAPTAPVFKYSTDLEKNKVFVRSLPFSASEEDVKELFAQHGAVKSVRLVTYMSGKPKGLAYVEYEEEASATQAILKLDNTDFKGFTIAVALSCPPQRRAQASTEFTPTLGGGKKEGVDRGGRSRTMLSFAPRSVTVKTQPGKTASSRAAIAAAAAAAGGGGLGNGSQPPQKSKMSNDDFRNMLLKK